jgi:hypothetical protein
MLYKVRAKSAEKARLVFACLILLCLITGNAYGLRCGTDLVNVGDRKLDVLRKCGEPAVIDEWEEELSLRRSPQIERLGEDTRRRIFVRVEEWTYNFGPTNFIQILTFKNGELVEIRTGGRGY